VKLSDLLVVLCDTALFILVEKLRKASRRSTK